MRMLAARRRKMHKSADFVRSAEHCSALGGVQGLGRAMLGAPIAAMLVSLAAGGAIAADKHIGPVVSMVSREGRVFSSSQGGVFLERDGKRDLLSRPKFRVFGMAVVPRQGAKEPRLLLVGGTPGESGVIALLNTATGKSWERKVAKDVVYDVAVSMDGKAVALACADNRVLTLDLATFAKGALNERHKHTADVRAVAWSPDGARLVSGGLDGVLLVSRSDEQGKIRILQQHSAGVESLAFSPDGRFFASGSRDAKVRIHTAVGEYVRTYTGLGMEAMRSGLERKPHIVALAWGGKQGDLIAGASTGGLYRLAADNANWEKLDWSGDGPVFSLTFGGRDGLFVGLDAKAELAGD